MVLLLIHTPLLFHLVTSRLRSRMPLVEELSTAHINDLALNTTLYYAADMSYMGLDIALSSILFGTSAYRSPVDDPVDLQVTSTGILSALVIVAVMFLTYVKTASRLVCSVT